jgi:hypothetical protein
MSTLMNTNIHMNIKRIMRSSKVANVFTVMSTTRNTALTNTNINCFYVSFTAEGVFPADENSPLTPASKPPAALIWEQCYFV